MKPKHAPTQSFANHRATKTIDEKTARNIYRMYVRMPAFFRFFGWHWLLIERADDDAILDQWAQKYNAPHIKKLRHQIF